MKVLWIVGVVLIMLGVKARIDFQAFQISPIRVMADVLGSANPTKEMRVPRAGQVALRYAYNGKVHESSNTAIGPFWKALRPGDHIELVLNEKNPSRFIAAAQLPNGGYFGYFLMVAGAVVLLAARLV